MKVYTVFFAVVLVGVSGDAPPLPYATAVAQPASFPSEHVQGVATQYSDHFGAEGFNVQSPYEGYLVPAGEHNFFPITEGLDLRTHGLVPKLLKNLLAFGWKVVPKIAVGAAVLLLFFLVGSCVNALVCSFTPFCTISFLGVGVTKETMRSYLTPDRITSTANFVADAIKKYKDLYEISSNEIDSGKKSGKK